MEWDRFGKLSINPAPPGVFRQPRPPGGRGPIGPPPLRSRKPKVIRKKMKRRWKRLTVFYSETEFQVCRLTYDVTGGQNRSKFDLFRKSLITRELFDVEQNQRYQSVCLDLRIPTICDMTLKGHRLTLTWPWPDLDLRSRSCCISFESLGHACYFGTNFIAISCSVLEL